MVNFQPSSKDNWLRGETGLKDTNYGNDVYLRTAVGVSPAYRSILAFDISSIPAGATITSVKLHLYLNAATPGISRTLNLHKILEAWLELQSTWNSRKTGVAWSGAGCEPDDSSSSSTVSGSKVVTATLGWYIWGSTAQMIADVQDWLDNPGNNEGWLLKDSDETGPYKGTVWYSNYYTLDLTKRPKLEVEYTEAAPGPGGFGVQKTTLELIL